MEKTDKIDRIDFEEPFMLDVNHVKTNHFYIYGEFDDSFARTIIPSLVTEIQTQKEKKNGKIIFHINSPGGYAHFLYDVLAYIELAKKEGIIIETHAYSAAYSCASLLAASGTKGYRFVSNLSENLVHLGYTQPSVVKNDTELERESKGSKTHFNRIRELYKKYAKIPNLNKMISTDFLTFYGEEIVKVGLADKVI